MTGDVFYITQHISHAVLYKAKQNGGKVIK